MRTKISLLILALSVFSSMAAFAGDNGDGEQRRTRQYRPEVPTDYRDQEQDEDYVDERYYREESRVERRLDCGRRSGPPPVMPFHAPQWGPGPGYGHTGICQIRYDRNGWVIMVNGIDSSWGHRGPGPEGMDRFWLVRRNLEARGVCVFQ